MNMSETLADDSNKAPDSSEAAESDQALQSDQAPESKLAPELEMTNGRVSPESVSAVKTEKIAVAQVAGFPESEPTPHDNSLNAVDKVNNHTISVEAPSTCSEVPTSKISNGNSEKIPQNTEESHGDQIAKENGAVDPPHQCDGEKNEKMNPPPVSSTESVASATKSTSVEKQDERKDEHPPHATSQPLQSSAENEFNEKQEPGEKSSDEHIPIKDDVESPLKAEDGDLSTMSKTQSNPAASTPPKTPVDVQETDEEVRSSKRKRKPPGWFDEQFDEPLDCDVKKGQDRSNMAEHVFSDGRTPQNKRQKLATSENTKRMIAKKSNAASDSADKAKRMIAKKAKLKADDSDKAKKVIAKKSVMKPGAFEKGKIMVARKSVQQPGGAGKGRRTIAKKSSQKADGPGRKKKSIAKKTTQQTNSTGKMKRSIAKKSVQTINGTGKMKRTIAKKSAHKTTEKIDFDAPVVGTRVYARWPPTNTWYWGTIFDVIEPGRSPGRGRTETETFYRIRFDDGDERPLVPKEDFVTEQVFRLNDEQERPAKPVKVKKKRESKGNPNSGIAVGVRCYAKFTDGGWHWGTITDVAGKGVDMTCAVLFDDGDTRDKVRVYDEVMTEAEYRPEYGAMNHSEFNASLCQECTLCTKPECGHCCACLANSHSTSIFKECCLFKGCVKLDPETVSKQVPYFPLGWKFYFGERTTKHISPPLHPYLDGFVVVGPKTKQCREPDLFVSLESAGEAAGATPEIIRKAEKEIFENFFGLKIRKPEEHFLVGKGYCRQWLQPPGRPAFLYGFIESCERDRFNDHLFFRVRYTEESLSLIVPATSCSSISKIKEVGERVAWAGCLLFEEKTMKSSEISTGLAETTCVPLKWLVPESVTYEELPPDRFTNGTPRPKMTMTYKGTTLEFETRKSTIPNAGLGVFLRCSSSNSETPMEKFELKNGEMLDMGTYAPLSDSDFKDGSLFLFKNFIFDWASEGWSFDATGCEPGRKLFDITDDSDGKLHGVATKNLPSYVNETNGIEIPSVRADYDPEGSVHYLLGHFQVQQGPLVLNMGHWVEVKIDYGPTYEDVRVRKGYSRLPPMEQLKVERRIKDDDKSTLEDIASWSVRDIEFCLIFLETKLPIGPTMDKSVARKCLMISLCLFMRLQEVREEFAPILKSHPSSSSSKAATLVDCCDNGYSTMEEKKLISRFRECLRKLLEFWKKSDTELRKVLTGESYIVFYMAKLLDCETVVLKRMSPAVFRKELNKALGISTAKEVVEVEETTNEVP